MILYLIGRDAVVDAVVATDVPLVDDDDLVLHLEFVKTEETVCGCLETLPAVASHGVQSLRPGEAADQPAGLHHGHRRHGGDGLHEALLHQANVQHL